MNGLPPSRVAGTSAVGNALREAATASIMSFDSRSALRSLPPAAARYRAPAPDPAPEESSLLCSQAALPNIPNETTINGIRDRFIGVVDRSICLKFLRAPACRNYRPAIKFCSSERCA
jgi:hypothetical protein